MTKFWPLTLEHLYTLPKIYFSRYRIKPYTIRFVLSRRIVTTNRILSRGYGCWENLEWKLVPRLSDGILAVTNYGHSLSLKLSNSSKCYKKFIIRETSKTNILRDLSIKNETFVVFRFWLRLQRAEKIRVEISGVLKWRVHFGTKIGYFETAGKNSVFKLEKWIIYRSIRLVQGIFSHSLDCG